MKALLLVVALAFAVSGCETMKSIAKEVCSSEKAQDQADKSGVDLCPDFITK